MRALKVNRSHSPASKPHVGAFGEKIDEGRVIVQAGDLLKRLAAGLEKRGASLLLDFLERLEAVGGERGANHQELFYAGLGQSGEFEIGEGREPRLADETRLEGDGMLVCANPRAGRERTGGREALRSEERRVGKECRSRWSPYH